MDPRNWSIFKTHKPNLPPNEIVKHIFSYLPPEAVQVRHVSKLFKKNQDDLDEYIMSHPERLLEKLMSFTNLKDLCFYIKHYRSTKHYYSLSNKFFWDETTNIEKLCFAIITDNKAKPYRYTRLLFELSVTFNPSSRYAHEMLSTINTALLYSDHEAYLGPNGARLDKEKLDWLQANPPTDKPLLYYLKARFLKFKNDQTFIDYQFQDKAFPCINLSNINLSNKDLTNTDFSFGILENTIFENNQKTDGLNLSHADLTQSRFRGASIKGVNVHGANLLKANLLPLFFWALI